jgi:hypothetical protein
MASGQVVNSMAVMGPDTVAVGNRLEHDSDFKAYSRIDLHGRMLIPGLTDAHTHFYQLSQSRSQVSLDGSDSLDECLKRIKTYAESLPARRWVLGSGFNPELFRTRVIPDREMLDRVTGGRPAFIFFKDTHSVWVNSRALDFADIDETTPDPIGGQIERNPDHTPSGILREIPAYAELYRRLPKLPRFEAERCYRETVEDAYRKGVTGVHSFDGPDGFQFLVGMEERGKLGLRINYYPPAATLDDLERTGTVYGTGTDFFRIAGVKLFADGALGSQSALCFNKYLGSRDNFGIEVTGVKEMTGLIKRAARLGLPSAIHAIGDRAVANVLDALEASKAGKLRHRIEHLQMVRRKDLARVKKLAVVASMQPSHCPADITMVRAYWGARSRNAYVFRSVLDTGIELAFGSDTPIEPLDPIAGIAAAVRRARPNSRDVFQPEQRIFAHEALRAFTVGPAWASGQEHTRGRLLPGFPADFAVLDRDPTGIAPSRIYGTRVLATVLDGTVCYAHSSLNW